MSLVTASSARTLGRGTRRVGVAVAAAFALVTAGLSAGPPAQGATGCRIYVASGDDVTVGRDLDDNTKRYPEQLLEDHLKAPGWCVYNQGKKGVTTATYVTGGSMSSAYNMRPDLHTITLGEQNNPVVDAVDSCFEKVKSHDFPGAIGCASAILANQSVWTGITNNYTTILQTDRIMASQRPALVVAVTGYPNPYPRASDVATDITSLCTPLIDTTITCLTRWLQLPAALTLLDQVFTKLNSTVKAALGPFQQGPNGNRFVFVDTYTKLAKHCMKMDVQIKTKVEHPEESGAVHEHDSQTVSFGCDDPWFVEGSTGRDLPFYLIPATPGVLIEFSQTTEGMGVWPDADGHQCIADLIWEADTIDPGTTPLKWKLGYGEPSKSDVCS